MNQRDQCLAELHISDDEGDSFATMTCSLERGHDGLHVEQYQRKNNGVELKRIMMWEGDDHE